jgi:hypothetical protein
MARTVKDFTDAMPDVIRDEAKRLDALDRFAIQAITGRYSKDAPVEVVSDVPGNGTKYIDLPTDAANLVVFEPEFSTIRAIEYPIEQQPPQYVLDSDLRVYRKPDGYRILLNFDAPSAEDVLRVTWTARHRADGSTVFEKDFYAVVDYAASLALEALAAIYAQVGDPSIGADTVNYRTKSQEYLTLAKAVRKRYFVHMGVDESEQGTEQPAAFAMGNQYLNTNSGVQRLVHSKYSR